MSLNGTDRTNHFLQAKMIVLVALISCLSTVAANSQDVTDIPRPDPVAELAAMRLDPSTEVNLYAADPNIAKPVQMNFDSSGRLWIATSETYPQVEPGTPANDKIVVLSDQDGDGVAETSTVFADGLLIPTGVLPDTPHSAYVVDSTELLYMVDTDHDGKADQTEVLLSGFGTEDTHHLLHTLRMGPDGYLYCNQSIYIHSHIQTPDGTQRLDGGGIWRYHPPTGRLEIFCKGFINPWGHVFTPEGESFVTDGAFFEGINHTFPDAVFVTSPGATRWLSGLNPGSPKHCGLEILSGQHVPPSMRGDLVTNDFRSHRVCRFRVSPSASTYISRQNPELVTSPHVAFRPVDARMGPDGALYIADWYNPIIQHGEVDFRDPRRDRKHGRIWRLAFKDRPLDHWPDVASLTTGELVDHFDDPAHAVANHCRWEMQRRGGIKLFAKDPAKNDAFDKALSALDKIESSPRKILEQAWFYDAAGTISARWFHESVDELAASWSGGGETSGTIEPNLQRPLLRALARLKIWTADADIHDKVNDLVLACCQSHSMPLRLEAVAQAGRIVPSDSCDSQRIMNAVLSAAAMPTDDVLDFAIWQTIRTVANDRDAIDPSFVRTLSPTAAARLVDSTVDTRLANAGAEGLDDADGQAWLDLAESVAAAADADALSKVLQQTLRIDKPSTQSTAAEFLFDRMRADKTAPSEVGRTLLTFAERSELSPATLRVLFAAAGVYRLPAVIDRLLPRLQSMVQNNATAAGDLIASLTNVRSETIDPAVLRWSDHPDESIWSPALSVMIRQRPGAAASRLVKRLGTADPTAANLAAAAMSRKSFVNAFAKSLDMVNIHPDNARIVLRAATANGNDSLADLIRTSGQLTDQAYRWSPELGEELVQRSIAKGSPTRGESIYRRNELQCINCHAIGAGGSEIGPNLISIGGSAQPDYIVESLIAPDAKLKEGYTTRQILTYEGEVINGIEVGRSDSSLSLRLADGKVVTIADDDIELSRAGRSLMPAGLVDSLTRAELADLIAFLSAMGRQPEWTVSTLPVVRAMETLVYSNEANRRLNRTSIDSVAKNDPLMKWRSVTSKVSGQLPVGELDVFKQHKQTPPLSFIRFNVNMPAGGVAKIDLPGDGVDAFLGDKPIPTESLASIQLESGDHLVTLAINRDVIFDDDAPTIIIEGDGRPQL